MVECVECALSDANGSAMKLKSTASAVKKAEEYDGKMLISIIVPVLNERSILEQTCERLHHAVSRTPTGEWQVILADAGSSDGSLELLTEKSALHDWDLVSERMSDPSVGKTVNLALDVARGSVAVILPSDCSLSPLALETLHSAMLQGYRCGGFRKRYEPTNLCLRWYAALQNAIRSNVFRHLVWTNGIFFPLPMKMPSAGFLEDVSLSDLLRKRSNWTLLHSKISVSSRRYYPDRMLARIGVNLLIMCLHRLRLVSSDRLKKLYHSVKPPEIAAQGGYPHGSETASRAS